MSEYCKNCFELAEKLAKKEQECEKLKKQLMQKSEVDMFFNTPIEGWSDDPCGICPHKAENEELKKEIINKNEKIKELRFSVSDLTNRLCCLNAEKSFRIVDLEQGFDEIEKIAKDGLNPICYKSNCSRCKCYNGDDCKAGMISLINNYFTKNGEFVDGNGDFAEALEGLLESERKKCNKAQPIAQQILDIINKAKEK